MNELCRFDIAMLSRLLSAREIGAVELVEALIGRAGAVPHVHVTPLFGAARDAARAADREISRGDWRGPLHGIPFGVKDAIGVAEAPTTNCSRLAPHPVAREDAVAVARLRRAGAIPLGKVHCAELCLGAPGAQDSYPWPANPHSADHSSGGSSSGSAVGLAAGLFPAALGTDTAGSIRLPAAFCGVAGLKPTDGLLPAAGIAPLAPSLDQVGPLGRSSRDCALLLDALVPGGAHLAAFSVSLAGIRLGIDPELAALVAPAWCNALESARAVFGTLGAVFGEVTLPPAEAVSDCALTLMLGEANAIHGARIARHPERVSRITRLRIEAGAHVGHALAEARQRQKALAGCITDAMREVDAVLLPVAAGDPPRRAGIQPLAYMRAPMFTTYANIAGLPAASVRCGKSPAGVPMAFQVMAPRHSEALVLRIADAFERATPELTMTPI